LKFDEEGENIIDSASGLNGTIVGSLERTEGKIDNALYFNGESYVDLSNALESVSDLSEGTIAFWFNYESTLDEQLIMPIFYIGNSDTGDPDSMFIIEIGHAEFADSGPKLNPSHKPLYVTWTDNEAEPFLCFDSRNNIEENKWHHFAVVLSQNGNTGYLNGEEMTERRYNFSRASNKSFLDSISNKELFTLGYGKGNKELSPEFTYFKGKIDDLRIYNKPLSSTEITELTSSN